LWEGWERSSEMPQRARITRGESSKDLLEASYIRGAETQKARKLQIAGFIANSGSSAIKRAEQGRVMQVASDAGTSTTKHPG